MHGNTHGGGALDAGAEELEAVGAVVARGAFVEGLEVDGVLQGTILDEGALGDLLVVLGQAHYEAEVDLRLRVQLAGAELDDVAQALGRAMLALDAIVARGSVRACQLRGRGTRVTRYGRGLDRTFRCS